MGPKTESSGDPFFQVFLSFQDPLRIEKCKQSCTGGMFCSPARGPQKLFFSRFSGLLFWLHVGSVLAPSWPHPGLSWPLLAHLGPSWPHLGSILAPSWPLLAPLCALLAPSWHYSWPQKDGAECLCPMLANWSAILNPGFRPPLPQVRPYRSMCGLVRPYEASRGLRNSNKL